MQSTETDGKDTIVFLTAEDERSDRDNENITKGALMDLDRNQEGLLNPVTGEINWDCPCLGGMASGPCKEEFKQAFTCFVNSTDEVRGTDCISDFTKMHECFRSHSDVYEDFLKASDSEESLEEITGELVETNEHHKEAAAADPADLTDSIALRS